MKKLADISAFEGLQGQANRSMGAVSELAVFNGDYTFDVLREVREYLKKNPNASQRDIEQIAGSVVGNRAFSKGMTTTEYGGEPDMPNDYSASKFYQCTPGEQQRYLMRECEDAANAIASEFNIPINHMYMYASALAISTGYEWGDGGKYWENKIHRNDYSNPEKEYGL